MQLSGSAVIPARLGPSGCAGDGTLGDHAGRLSRSILVTTPNPVQGRRFQPLVGE